MRRSLAATSALVTAALLAACGGGDSPVELVTRSATATLEQPTARVDFTVVIEDLPGAAGPIQLGGEGVLDLAGDQAELSVDMGALFSQLPAGVEVPPEVAAVLAEPMRTVQDGTVIYLCGGFVPVAFGADCARFDLAELSEAFADLMGGQSFGDPTAFVESLKGAGEVERVGEETVRGVLTEHLRGTFTLQAALDALPDDAATDLRRAYEQLGIGESFLEEPLAFEAWVDGDGLVRRLVQTIDMATLSGGEVPGRTTVTMELFDFGVETDITIPADAVDLGGLLGG